jgi:hypothetical protein
VKPEPYRDAVPTYVLIFALKPELLENEAALQERDTTVKDFVSFLQLILNDWRKYAFVILRYICGKKFFLFL